MRALHVVFGAGPLGRALLKAVADRGHRGRVVDVQGVPLEVPLGIEVRRGDARDPVWLTRACEEASVVYDALEPGKRTARARAALAAGVAEHTDTRLVRLERLTAAAPPEDDPHERLEPHLTVGRVGDLFGGGWDEGPLAAEALRRVAAGERTPFPGNPDLPHTWAYLPDVARALVVLGETPRAAAQGWHLPCAPPLTTRELLRLACEAAGRPGAMPRLKIVRGEARFGAPWVVPDSRFLDAFGAEAARVTPLRAAIAAAVADARSHD